MRILGIDFGDSRTGIAISDPLGWTAQGLETASGGMNAAAVRIAQLAHQYNVKTIVVGYPLNMNGSAGFRAERTDSFIAALKKQISKSGGNSEDSDNAGNSAGGAEIIKWDERLSTAEAARALRSAGAKQPLRGAREKGKLDIVAASIILQSYLDSIDSINRTDSSPSEGEQL